MSLLRCDTAGAPRIVETEPLLETRHDALFVPATGGWAARGWGVYDAAGGPIVAAATRPAWTAPADALAAAQPPPEPRRLHVYAGTLAADATFFLDTLARFWGRATSGADGARLVFHDGGALELVWATPHLAEALAAFGVGPQDCLVPGAPTRFPHLLVPAPAFVAGHFAHRAFGRVMATLGLRLGGDGAPPACAPLHLSHAREAEPAFRGEAEFDAALDGAGFTILHSGALPLASVARQLRAAALVTATRPGEGRLAPADLLSALAPGRRRLTLTPDGQVPIDARLIDAAAGHETFELRPTDTSPAAMAAAFTEAAARAIAVWRLPCRLAAPAPGELGVTLGGVASCIEAAEGSATAVLGGLRTGHAQLRTAWRQRPWWQVVWGVEVALTAIRVHLPVGSAPHELRLLGSHDGVDWQVLARSAEPLVFVSDQAWRLRILRLQRMTDGVLALDQVEAIGAPAIDLAEAHAA